jgi:NTP pyrophosphatase (non-canonical NTP hydrolase)
MTTHKTRFNPHRASLESLQLDIQMERENYDSQWTTSDLTLLSYLDRLVKIVLELEQKA